MPQNPVEPRAIDARGEYIRQEVKRKDAAVVQAVGYPAVAYFGGSARGGGLHADVRYELSATHQAVAGVKGLGLVTPTTMGNEGRLSFGAYLGAGGSF